MMNQGLKNPYSRTHNAQLPIENPLVELKEDELLQVSGAAEERWLEVIISGVACAAASYFMGNPGHMCTLTVECQRSCN
ncbi:plantaricin C family lantibiotic [Xylanibacillus composti]|uniref:Plantaricin C family lantibiotic n=1 Tax=Xylanibacillus composti TaxID=1572762 RepID=A0A8J4H3S6_9BACL|nr:plantaricin C family lantibiotic [Xylanibacillus composti]MDT9725353.1 plantaricin C family lantibiotic [Xylanibacillus composti]GIQ69115.1 hypothetical protein XYCOK13_19390 [Xylanibacillus composti]